MDEIIENPPTNYNVINQALTESNHPVLTNLKTQIAQLETQLATAKADADSNRERWQRWMNAKNKQEENFKQALLSALSDDQDEDTVRYIARSAEIDLTVSKKFEVNVTFTIDVELEIGQEIDPDWDFMFSVSNDNDNVIDYNSDVIWSNEIS